MAVAYDKYYRTQNLFGDPYPELIKYFANLPTRGNLLDLGCGQGRDALPLARLGYQVTGIDNSVVGIQQMVELAKSEGLKLTGIVEDIYEFRGYVKYDFILLDSMFHFRKSELKQESELIDRIIQTSKAGTLIVFCIQDSGNKIPTFNRIIRNLKFGNRRAELDFKYKFVDQESNHQSETNYKMIVIGV